MRRRLAAGFLVFVLILWTLLCVCVNPFREWVNNVVLIAGAEFSLAQDDDFVAESMLSSFFAARERRRCCATNVRIQ